MCQYLQPTSSSLLRPHMLRWHGTDEDAATATDDLPSVGAEGWRSKVIIDGAAKDEEKDKRDKDDLPNLVSRLTYRLPTLHTIASSGSVRVSGARGHRSFWHSHLLCPLPLEVRALEIGLLKPS